MSRVVLSALAFLMCLRSILTAADGSPVQTLSRVARSFEVNLGQADGEIDFFSRAPESLLFLNAGEAVLALPELDVASDDRGAQGHPTIVRMKLDGADRRARSEALGELRRQSNYYLGDDPSGWLVGIPHFQRVKYEGIYPCIDIVYYYSDAQELEFDFVLGPGADPEGIRLSFEGVDHLLIDESGDVLLGLQGGELRLRRPRIFEGEAERIPVDGKYVLRGSHELAFEIGARDASRALLIDPVLVYSTYLGGSAIDLPMDVAVNSQGNTYVAGYTHSTNFPLAGAIQGSLVGYFDAFVARFSPGGDDLEYATYLGGMESGIEGAFGIQIFEPQTGNPHAIVVGTTSSPGFPTTTGAYDRTHNGATDAFVVKLAPDGTLVYSTYLGGPGDDRGYAVDVDSAGRAYLTGASNSLPTTANAYQPQPSRFCRYVAATRTFGYMVCIPTMDAFLAKLDSAGARLLYSSLIGGSSTGGPFGVNGVQSSGFGDVGFDIAVNDEGFATIAGVTQVTLTAASFPTKNAMQPAFGGGQFDGFVARFDTLASGANSLVFSTYLGGAQIDYCLGLAQDGAGSVYAAGQTLSTGFPVTVGAFDTTLSGGSDGFVTKLSRPGALVYSTFLGGSRSGVEYVARVAVDGAGSAVVTGSTLSPDFPTTTDAAQRRINRGLNLVASDAFVARLAPSGSSLLYSTFLGGSLNEVDTIGNTLPPAHGLSLDSSGNIHVIGKTVSLDLPTLSDPTDVGPLQPTFAGVEDAFVAKIGNPLPQLAQAPIWTRQFGTSEPDTVIALCAAPSGVYVAGTTRGAFPGQTGTGTTLFLRRYDHGGTEVWTRQFGATRMTTNFTEGQAGHWLGATAADDSAVYIAGVTDFYTDSGNYYADAIVRKYDLDGGELWTRQFRALTYPWTVSPRGLALTSTGLYLAGLTLASLPGQPTGALAAFVRRYDHDGNEEWTRVLWVNNQYTFGESVAAAADGVYLVGTLSAEALPGQVSQGSSDGFVWKYDHDGNVLWASQFGTTSSDEAAAVAADGAGVSIAGLTDGVFPGQTAAGSGDAYVRRYDRDGNHLWTRQFGSPAFEAARAVSADASGVYVVGNTGGTLAGQPSSGGYDVFARRYDFAGNEVWTRQFGTSGWENLLGVGAAGSALYAAGYTTGVFPGGTGYGDYDAFVTKLDLGPGISDADTDGDGLLDSWEIVGLDADGDQIVDVDLPGMGANPLHKDVFVEIDFMVGTDGHSHRPTSRALQSVIDAFTTAPVANPDGASGVRIHIDAGPASIMDPTNGQTWGGRSGSDALPHADQLGTSGAGGYDWSAFDAIKAENLAPGRARAFHYCVFAHNLGGTPYSQTSGISRSAPASDFIVSLGSWDGAVGTDSQQTGTLMHELGHNFGLLHGGNDTDNWKPNYLSVMGYWFQMRGLRFGGADGRFDYSRFTLPQLDENALSEPRGLRTATGPVPGTSNYGTRFMDGRCCQRSVNDINAGIDWSGNGSALEAVARADLNRTPPPAPDLCLASCLTDSIATLYSTNDWDLLVYRGGSIGSTGALVELPLVTPDAEISTEEDDSIVSDYAVSANGPGVVEIEACAATTCELVIVNRGTLDDVYSLAASATRGFGDLSLLPAEVSLAAGASIAFEIPVRVPVMTEGAEDLLILMVTSQTQPAIADTVETTLRVSPPTDLDEDGISDLCNRPPVADAGGPYSVEEGQTVLLAGSGFDPEGAALEFAWDLDGDDVFETPGETATFSAAGFDGPTDGIVRLQVTDPEGLTGVAEAAIHVSNAAPTLEAISAPLDPVQIGTTFVATAELSDPGEGESHEATWDWGDGTTSAGEIVWAGESGSVSGAHSYSAPGVFTIHLTVVDDDGASAQSVFQYVVAYDPEGGFVTGGGWIHSPPGASVIQPGASGKATFGFVAKYKKGAQVPDGQTHFSFQASDLSFTSASYDWLVVAGARAQFKGSGSVNGTSGYKFLLAGTDGQVAGGGGTDKFRIKIWESASGQVIYDNMMGSPDDASPSTELGGGSIVVHHP